MKGISMKISAALILGALAILGGCGLEGKAKTRFGVDSFGRFSAESSKDESIAIGRVKVWKSTTTQPAGFEAENVNITSNASAVNPTIATIVDANARLMAVHGANINEGVRTIAGAIGPIAQAYIGGRHELAMAKLQRPGLLRELSEGVLDGSLDVRGLSDAFPQDIVAEVRRIIEERLERLKKESAEAPTQPTMAEMLEVVRKEIEKLRPPTSQPSD